MVVLGYTVLASGAVSKGNKRAKGEEALTVVYSFSKYREYCTAIDRDVPRDRAVGGAIKRDVIYPSINIDKNLAVARKRGVWLYPTTFLVEKMAAKRSNGSRLCSKKEFEKMLLYSTEKNHETTGFRGFLKKTKSNHHDINRNLENRPVSNKVSAPIGCVDTLYYNPS